MKICKHCECINGDGVNRCENCGRPLDKCREITKEQIIEEDRRIIRRKRRGRRVFACVSLIIFVALYITAIVRAAGSGSGFGDGFEEKAYYILGWIFSPVFFAVWFLSVIIPEKLYKAHYNVDSFFTSVDLFLDGYDVDRNDLQPNFIFDIKYKIGLVTSYIFSFLIVILYIVAS